MNKGFQPIASHRPSDYQQQQRPSSSTPIRVTPQHGATKKYGPQSAYSTPYQSSQSSYNASTQKYQQKQAYHQEYAYPTSAIAPPTNNIEELERLPTEELWTRRGAYSTDPRYRQEIILIDSVLKQRDTNRQQYQGGCDPRREYYRDNPPDDEDKARFSKSKAIREGRVSNFSPYRPPPEKYKKNGGTYKNGTRRGDNPDSTDEEVEGITSGSDLYITESISEMALQFTNLSIPPCNANDLEREKITNFGEEKEADLQSGQQQFYSYYQTAAGGYGGGGGGDSDDPGDDGRNHPHRHDHRGLGNRDIHPPGTTPPPRDVETPEVLLQFPSMDEVVPPYVLQHAVDGNVCGGTSEHEDYKLIKGVTKEIDLDKCPHYMDEFLYFKRNINTFMEVTKAAISRKVTIYTMVAVLMLRTKRYHHIIKRLADRKEYYTSFRHFVRVFIHEQWPNAKDRALHLSQFCKQKQQSIEVYFESFVAIYEEFGTSLDDHIIKFIDGLTNPQLRERVRCNDYKVKTLMTVREYAIRTWQNMEAEMACRNKSLYNKSPGNQITGGFGRQRGSNRGRGRGRGRGGYGGQGRGGSQNGRSSSTIATIKAAPRNNGRGGRSRSAARGGAKNKGRSASAPGRSASRGTSRGRSRSANRGRSSSRARSASSGGGRARSSSADNRRSATPGARVNALDSTSKREEAIQVARRLKLKGCIGCAGSHRYQSFFRDCHRNCPFCKKTFTRNDNRHLSMLCRSMPKEKSDILKMIWAARDNRE